MTAAVLARFFREHSDRFSSVATLHRDLHAPSACADVRQFAIEKRQELEALLYEIIPPGLEAELGLTNGRWIDLVAGPESRLANAEMEISSDFRAIQGIERWSLRFRAFSIKGRLVMSCFNGISA
jgi:hypothetical protein